MHNSLFSWLAQGFPALFARRLVSHEVWPSGGDGLWVGGWMRRTLIPRVHHAGAYRQEQDALLLVPCVVFRHGDVQRAFADAVGRVVADLPVVDKVRVGHARGDGDDFLDLAFLDQGHEYVDGVDRAEDVDSEVVEQVFFENGGVVVAVKSTEVRVMESSLCKGRKTWTLDLTYKSASVPRVVASEWSAALLMR